MTYETTSLRLRSDVLELARASGNATAFINDAMARMHNLPTDQLRGPCITKKTLWHPTDCVRLARLQNHLGLSRNSAVEYAVRKYVGLPSAPFVKRLRRPVDDRITLVFSDITLPLEVWTALEEFIVRTNSNRKDHHSHFMFALENISKEPNPVEEELL